MALSIVQNLKKFLQRIQNHDDAPFLGPKWSICSNFFWNTINIILIYLLVPSVKFKKNSSSRSRVMRMCNFWAQNGLFSQIKFFQKTCQWALFLLLMPITCQKSKSDINLLVKWLKVMIKEYWNLIGREPFFSLTWELDFSQAYSFPRMLMNHKNFDFTQIPEKTNDMIFLKSSKTMFLGHFWPFLPEGDFFQKIQLSNTTIYGH